MKNYNSYQKVNEMTSFNFIPNAYEFEHSTHSKKRASQRGIGDQIIEHAIQFGKEMFKQGLIFYTVAEKNLPLSIDISIREKLNNLVVVMAGDSDQIITCYKSDNAIKHLKRKSKTKF